MPPKWTSKMKTERNVNRKVKSHYWSRASAAAAFVVAVLFASLLFFRQAGPSAYIKDSQLASTTTTTRETETETAAAAAEAALVGATEALSVALARANETSAAVRSVCFPALADAMAGLGAVLDAMLAHAVSLGGDDDATVGQSAHMALSYEVYRAAALYSFGAIHSTPLHAADPSLLRWIAATCFALTHIMPEFLLLTEDGAAHGEVLVLGLRLLIKASNALPGETALRLHDCEIPASSAYTKGWMKFCNNTFVSAKGLELRRAAVLEELIALYPEFGPLRLHYAVAITLTGHTSAAARIRSERARVKARTDVDALHSAVLLICEAYLQRPAPTHMEAVSALGAALGQFDSCERLLRPFDAGGGVGWQRNFAASGRPDVMDHWQAQRLMDAMRNAVPLELFSDKLVNLIPLTTTVDGMTQKLRDLHYSVLFSPDPLPPAHDASEYYPMRLSNGTTYMCVLPPATSLTNTGIHSAPDSTSFRENGIVPSDVVAQLHNALRNWCFTLTKDWWTYKMCWNKRVEQYHRQVIMYYDDNSITDLTESVEGHFLLGKVSNEAGGDMTANPNALEYRFGQDPTGERYVKTVYKHGTRCDLTKMPRETEVRLYCSLDNEEGRLMVQEVEVCRYVSNLATRRACIPALQSRHQRNDIFCHTVVPSSPQTIIADEQVQNVV